mgnify:CR=1 FL=1
MTSAPSQSVVVSLFFYEIVRSRGCTRRVSSV